MKKTIYLIVVILLSLSLIITGVSCKTDAVEETTEEITEEVAEETSKEAEETMEETGEPVTLRMADFVMEHTQPLLDYFIPLYEEKTGGRVKIEHEAMEVATFSDRLIMEGIAGTGYYTFGFNCPSWDGLFADYNVDLTPYIEKYDFDITQYNELLWGAFGESWVKPSKVYGIPLAVTMFIWAYRKDWFEDPGEQAAFKEQYGRDLLPITSLQDYYDKGKFFTRKAGETVAGEVLEEDIYGMIDAIGGPPSNAARYFTQYMWSAGLESFDTEFVTDINDPILLDAYELYASYVRDLMPEEAFILDYPDAAEKFFAEGRSAQTIIFGIPDIVEAEDAVTKGKVGYMVFPMFEGNIEGLDHGRTHFGGGGLGIFDEEKADEAFKFISWLLGPEMEDEYVERIGQFPRINQATSPALLSKPGMEDAVPVIVEAMSNTYKQKGIPEYVGSIHLPAGTFFLDCYNGLTTPEEAQEAWYNAVVETMTNAGYYD